MLEYQSKVVDVLEASRKDRIIGWYHSHPFDLKETSNAFLSATDVQTQRVFQMATDQHDFSFVALVVDPLRSMARGVPDIGAFRTVPASAARGPLAAPDNSDHAVMDTIKSRWGGAYRAYYALEVQLFGSPSSAAMLRSLTHNHLWVRALSASSWRSTEAADHTAKTLADATAGLASTAKSIRATGYSSQVTLSAHGEPQQSQALAQAAAALQSAAMDAARATASQAVRHSVFDEYPAEARLASERGPAAAATARTHADGATCTCSGSHMLAQAFLRAQARRGRVPAAMLASMPAAESGGSGDQA